MKIKIGSENESQLKRIRKLSLLFSQEGSLAPKVKKYSYLFNKSQKKYEERGVFEKVFLIQNLRSLFTFWVLFFEVL